MRLGMIAKPTEEGFRYVQSLGLEGLEICINVGEDTAPFLAQAAQIRTWSEQTGVAVLSIGRWGNQRLQCDGSVNEDERQHDQNLIDLAAALGCKNYALGVNAASELSYDANVRVATEYLRGMVAYAEGKGVQVNVYNCDWGGNFIVNKRAWDAILPQVPGLGIKYDTSHCIYRDSDYLQEMMEFGKHIRHFHVKGSLRSNGKSSADPAAGFDNVHWGAVFALLYEHNYAGDISIEPHSGKWMPGSKLGDFGIQYTIRMCRSFMLPQD